MKKFKFISAISVIFLLSGCLLSADVPDGKSGDGRVLIYAYNNKQQLIRQLWLGQSNIEGCYALGKKREAYRFSQIGYDYCQVFSSPNCAEGSEIGAYWDGGDYRVEPIDVSQAQLKLYRGNRWILSKQNENIEIGSFACYYPKSS